MALSPGTVLLLDISRRNWFWIVATIALGFLSGIFNGVSVALVVPAVLLFFGKSATLEGLPPIVNRVLSVFDGVPPNQRFVVTILAILAAILLKNGLVMLSTATGGHLSRSLVNEASFRGLRLILEVGIDFYTRMKSGELIQRLGSEMSGAVGTINTIVQIISAVITISTFAVALVSISWQLTVVTGIFSSLVVLCNRYFAITSKQIGRAGMIYGRQYSSALVETLMGIRLIKVTSNEEEEYGHLTQLVRQKQRVELKAQTFSALVNSINELLSAFALLAIVGVGRVIFVDDPNAYAAILLTYLFLLSRVLGLVTTLGKALNNLALCGSCVNAMVSFLDPTNKHFVPSGSRPFEGLRSEIVFENVSFYYPGNVKHPVLNGIDLTLPKGTTLALVGSSGAGKSTIADLLVRFYDPTGGRIWVDGVELQAFETRSFHQHLSLVSQDTFLFNDTVANNIAYACPGCDREAVIDATKRANAYDFIQELPEGFDTLLGDRGVRLSGGQQQRIAIARALLRDPAILILDEATSALDTVSERLVQQALTHLSRDRTTLVIAHRLSTVQNADQIAVLDRGQVVELGTHAELLARNGPYAELYRVQFAEPTAKVTVHYRNAIEELVLKEARAQLQTLAAAAQDQAHRDLDSSAASPPGEDAQTPVAHEGDPRDRASPDRELPDRDASHADHARGAAIPSSVAAPELSNIIAYALNRLPALYATTEEGLRYQRERASRELHHEIVQQVAIAINRFQRDLTGELEPWETRHDLPEVLLGDAPPAPHLLAVVGRISYEIRTRLNVTLGSLTLLTDGLIDDPREQRELVRETYRSSVQVLTTLSLLEETLELQGRIHETHTPAMRSQVVYQRALETAAQKVQFLLERMNNSLDVLASELVDDWMEVTPERRQQRQQRFQEVYDIALEILNRMEAIEDLEQSTMKQRSKV